MQLRKVLVFTLTLCLLLSFGGIGAAQETGDSGNSLQEALGGIVDYYKANKTNLETWWQVVGLKEAGEDLSRSPWVLPDWKIDQLDEDSQPTDYAGIILGMIAAGMDPKDVEGRNLVDELAALQNDDGSFGSWLHQTIWSVVALDKAGGNYDVNTKDTALNFLLSQQKEDGGFALMGEERDPDITGMVLLALAPHTGVEGVTVAIDRAVQCLKDLQLSSGGFASWGTENPESTAAVIRGLLACGEKDITSGEWQKPEGNMIDALFTFQLEDGSFIHSASETEYNAAATEQALLAVADMVNAGINYTVKTGKKHVADEKVEATVRLRVEGATENLADEIVTVIGGTALEVLQAAVGEENVTAPKGFITEILGEGGKQITEDLSTSWMYYVIRNGTIEPEAFSQGAGSYNVCDNDEVVFYIGAMDSTWAPKTFFPEVNIAPESPKAGGQITLMVKALKNDWMEGLVELTAEELESIGEYTVIIGDKEEKTQDGRLIFKAIKAGALPVSIINQNEAGYPNVIPYRGSISIGASSGNGSGGSSTPTCTPGVAVVGRNGEKLFGPATVYISSSNRWGETALGALEATGLPYNISTEFDGFVDSIAGQTGSGLEGWMFTVNDTSPLVSAKDYNITSGDKVIWYYSKSMEQEAPTWAQLISGGSSGSPSFPSLPTSFVTSTTGEAFLNPAAGGNIGLENEASINIPANALKGTEGVNVTIRKVSDPPAAPDGFKPVSPVFEFTVSDNTGYEFSRPVTLTFSFDQAAVPKGATPSVFYYDGNASKWVELGGTISGNTIKSDVERLTKFAIFVKEPAPFPVFVQVFPDVQSSFWASEAINRLYNLGYINGYPDGAFRPDNRITRAEFVSILNMVLDLNKVPNLSDPGSSPSQAAPSFSDVGPADWFYDAVKKTVLAGIVKGYGNNLFKPNKEITREELATMMANALAGCYEAGSKMNEKTGFTDDGSISGWARGSVAVAVKYGLVNGYPDNSFKPQGSATRAEACTIITNYLNLSKPTP